jgi:hypothetical protein
MNNVKNKCRTTPYNTGCQAARRPSNPAEKSEHDRSQSSSVRCSYRAAVTMMVSLLDDHRLSDAGQEFVKCVA